MLRFVLFCVSVDAETTLVNKREKALWSLSYKIMLLILSGFCFFVGFFWWSPK